MVTISFPPSPNNGDIYTFGGRSWIWNGYGWQVYPSSFTSGITINATTITGGTNGRILYDNSATIGELVTGTGVATAIGNNTNSGNGLAVLGAGGALAVAQGGTNSTSYTAGSVIFAGAGGTSLTQDNANLFWDDTNNIFLIGTNTSSGTNKLQVSTDARINGITVGLGSGSVFTNTAVGGNALLANTTGFYNTAVGFAALQNNTGAGANTAVGEAALYTNISGANNTAVGQGALYFSTTNNNSAFGQNCLYTNSSGANNSAFGQSALSYNTSGNNNAAFGQNSLIGNTTGSGNTSIGTVSLASVTTSSNNTAVGFGSLQYSTTAGPNTAIGYNSLQCTGLNIASGSLVNGQTYTITNVGTSNFTAVGASANQVGVTFTASGSTAGSGTAALNGSGGANNVAVGDSALTANTGSNNTAIGSTAGTAVTSGSNNTLVGVNSGNSISTGSNNVILGAYTGSAAPISGTGSGYIVFSDGAANIRQVITNSGVALFGGLTSATANGAVIETSNGLTFPATQVSSTNVNTLDDYEEGAWTPTISFGGGSTGVTYAQAGGVYTKIGRLVYVSAVLQLSNKGSSTGAALIGGLPFAVASSYVAGSVGYQANFTGLTAGLTLYSDITASTIWVYAPNTTGAASATDANFTNNSWMIFSMTYQAAT